MEGAASKDLGDGRGVDGGSIAQLPYEIKSSSQSDDLLLEQNERVIRLVHMFVDLKTRVWKSGCTMHLDNPAAGETRADDREDLGFRLRE
jgi:hypothetical protein